MRRWLTALGLTTEPPPLCAGQELHLLVPPKLPSLPPLARDRVRLRADGRVLVELKTAWRDGTSHLVLDPIEFMEKLAAITPSPRSTWSAITGVIRHPSTPMRARGFPDTATVPLPPGPPMRPPNTGEDGRPVFPSSAVSDPFGLADP